MWLSRDAGAAANPATGLGVRKIFLKAARFLPIEGLSPRIVNRTHCPDRRRIYSHMNLTAVTRVQLGFSIAAISGMTIALAELLIHCPPLRSHAELLCGAAGGIGLLMWVGGRITAAKAASADNSLAYLAEPRYWGLLLALSALLAYSHSALSRSQSKPVTRVAQAVSAPPPEATVFPHLKLEGIVFQGAKSSALINGKVLALGDDIEQAQLVRIDPDHVAVTLQGQTNVLYLGR